MGQTVPTLVMSSGSTRRQKVKDCFQTSRLRSWEDDKCKEDFVGTLQAHDFPTPVPSHSNLGKERLSDAAAPFIFLSFFLSENVLPRYRLEWPEECQE